jgi:vacuolar-type H+-ATPase subunit H
MTNEIEQYKKEHLNVLKENRDKQRDEIRKTLQDIARHFSMRKESHREPELFYNTIYTSMK